MTTAVPAAAMAPRLVQPMTPARRRQLLEQAASLVLTAIGEDPTREGLQQTPRRWADWWLEFAEYEDGRTETVFEATSDQMVVVTGLRVWSLCEHHLLPFYADLTIGYITHGRLIGLSKFGRIAHLYAHRLQVQERLVEQIADHVRRLAATEDVAVMAHGEHLCMTMRGIRAPAKVQTSVTHGLFRSSDAARAEFFTLANRRDAKGG